MTISEGDNGSDTTSVIVSEVSDVLFEARVNLPAVNHTEAVVIIPRSRLQPRLQPHLTLPSRSNVFE